jgi:DUF1365 family protein
MTASAIYTGTIRHRRFAEREREFRHGIALAYIDLEELPHLLGGLLVRGHPGPLRFRRSDYFGEGDLAEAVRHRLGIHTGGPVRLLTQLRSFGHCFNPVSLYYAFDEDEGLQSLLAEVTNTPWGERQEYALTRRAEKAHILEGKSEKLMHVSPFLAMGQTYSWRVTEPGETLSVHIENWEGGEKAFDATLALKRDELTRGSLAKFPLASLRTLALIYGHAAAIRLRGIRTNPHPARAAT